MEIKNIFLLVFVFLIYIPIAFSTGEFYTPNENEDYLIDNYDYYFKDQRTDDDYVESRNNYCSEVGYSFQGEFGGTAIADIDNNGKNNIIAADETFIGCEGFLYNFEFDIDWNIVTNDYTGLGSRSIGVDLGNTIAIANLNEDSKLEMAVPAFYGLKLYSISSLNLFSNDCSTNHARLAGTPVIYDINRDNEYEIIYPTYEVGL